MKELNYTSKKILITILLCIGISGVLQVEAQSWPAGIHDPSSIVKCGDKYWVFGTGDGIHAMYSYDLVTWEQGPSPFTKTEFPDWINDYVNGATDGDGNPIFHGGFWAPDIIYMNDQYYLYYSCSEWGTMTSTIGCVTTKSLNPEDTDYGWTDVGFLGIWSYQPGLALNAIDPSLLRGHDGKIWMIYGSFNSRGMVVTEIDSVSGKPKNYVDNLPGTTIANSWTGPNSNSYAEGEGACMIYRDGYYYLFYSKGGCCNGIASTYYVVMGRSTSPTGPFVDKIGRNMVAYGSSSGGTVVLKHNDTRGEEDRYFGPGHIGVYRENGIDHVSFHYYSPNGYYPSEDANYKGRPTLGMGFLKWGADGWPSISMNYLDPGYYTLKNANSNKMLDVQGHSSADGKVLFQYAENDLYDTQKWLFSSLGTGEYTIRSYDDKSLYLETDGNYNGAILRLTDTFTGSINQKFRVAQSPNGKTLVYPSVQDNIMEIPYAYTSDYQVKLWPNTSHDCQRWYVDSFDETLASSVSNLDFSYRDTVCTSVKIESNGSWSIKVTDDSWLSVSPLEGTGNSTLTISATENTLSEERTNRITVTSKAGQKESIKLTQAYSTSTGISSEDWIELQVFPNPTNSNVTVKADQLINLEIYNSAGMKLKSYAEQKFEFNCDLSGYNSGIYLVKVIGKEGFTFRKVVKK